MHLVKGSRIAMQDGHQVHHRVVPSHQSRQCCLIVHVGFQHRQTRQMHHPAGVVASAGWHGNRPPQANQFFTHMGTDKAAAT